MLEKFINNIKDKRILILGFGREGQSSYFLIRRLLPEKNLGIADKVKFDALDNKIKNIVKRDRKVDLHFGNTYLKSLGSYDLVIKTPGIPNKLKEIAEAKKRGVEFTSQTKIFFEECAGIIIGITGTKGKSTTASLIFNILKKAGIKAVLLGNIGKPPLDYIFKDSLKTHFVFELSSHQLSDMTKSPHIAVLLNIYQEHLDYYENYNEYFEAKKNIARFQNNNDVFIYNFDDKNLRGVTKITGANVFSFSKVYKKDAFVSEGELYVRDKKNVLGIMKTNKINLRGPHNLNNVLASILVARQLNVAIKNIKKGIRSFKALPVRLEEIGKFGGIIFVLDALATIPEATIAALGAYSGKVETLICGGFDRGQNFRELAGEIIKQKVANLVLFPSTGAKIWEEVYKLSAGKKDLPKHYSVNNMKEAINICFKVTSKGKVCLLSAASSSFSVFKNYEEESDLFRKYVRTFIRK